MIYLGQACSAGIRLALTANNLIFYSAALTAFTGKAFIPLLHTKNPVIALALAISSFALTVLCIRGKKDSDGHKHSILTALNTMLEKPPHIFNEFFVKTALICWLAAEESIPRVKQFAV